MFARLKALKVEIEHLQLLMDKAKVKLQKEFEAWWAAEASSLQVLAAVPLAAPESALLLRPGGWQAAGEGPDMSPPLGAGDGAEGKEWGPRPTPNALSAPAS